MRYTGEGFNQGFKITLCVPQLARGAPAAEEGAHTVQARVTEKFRVQGLGFSPAAEEGTHAVQEAGAALRRRRQPDGGRLPVLECKMN